MSAKTWKWSADRVDVLADCLRRSTSLDEGLRLASVALGCQVSRSAADDALKRAGRGTAFSHLSGVGHAQARPFVPSAPYRSTPPTPANEDGGTVEPVAPGHDELSKLVSLAQRWQRRGGLTLETLCDELGLTPRQARALTERAIQGGYHVDIHDGALDFRPPEPQSHKEVVLEAPSAELGEELVIGVVSDPHFASKHHERSALQRHLEWLYENGARHIFGPGDWIAGGYPFLKYEVTSNGIEDQCEEAVAFIQSAGQEFSWEAIAGNHCESHKVGIDAAKMIEQMLHARGWTNFRYHGPRAARLRFGHTRIGLHHPGGGLSYALSYKIQKYIDAMPLRERPHFLFTGHTHQKLWIERGGVNGFLCGTFENGDSSFGRMLGGEVQVGGWLIRYRHDDRGGVASVNAEFRHQPHRKMNYVQVPA